MESVKSRVLSLCKKHSVTVSALEKKTGMSNGTISKWDDETIPSGYTLKRLADFFGVSVDYILVREDTTSAPRDEDIKFALFNGDSEITDEQFAEVKKFAQFIKERDKR